LSANFDNLLVTLNESINKVDVLALEETKLTKTKLELSAQFQIEGFVSLHVIRNTGFGGGTACYIKDINKVEQTEVKIHECESTYVTLSLGNTLVMFILIIYRPPRNNLMCFVSSLDSFLSSLIDEKIVIGDLNIDNLKKNYTANRYLIGIFSNGFSSQINKPTREEYLLGNLCVACLDHIHVEGPLQNIKSYVVSCKVSDHNLVASMIKNTF